MAGVQAESAATRPLATGDGSRRLGALRPERVYRRVFGRGGKDGRVELSAGRRSDFQGPDIKAKN